MAMLRKSFNGWTIKQEIQRLTAIRSPSPRLHPIRESSGSPTRHSPRSSLSPIPSLLFYCQNLPPTPHFRLTHQTTTCPLSNRSFETRLPSTAALDPKTTEEFARLDDEITDAPVEECGSEFEFDEDKDHGRPHLTSLHFLDAPDIRSIIYLFTFSLPLVFPLDNGLDRNATLGKGKDPSFGLLQTKEQATQDDVDRFYQEMSKEVQTILREQDQRMLPEEISRSRSVVVMCVYKGGMSDVYVLWMKHRSQVVAMELPHLRGTLEWLNMERNRKVVNKLEVDCEREFDVAFQEAMKYGGKVIPDDSPTHLGSHSISRRLFPKRCSTISFRAAEHNHFIQKANHVNFLH